MLTATITSYGCNCRMKTAVLGCVVAAAGAVAAVVGAAAAAAAVAASV